MADIKPPLTPYVQRLIDLENQKVKADSDKDAGHGKRFWIYFVDSGNWVEGTRAGFDKAIKDYRPVRRSKAKPRKPPAEFLREPEPQQ